MGEWLPHVAVGLAVLAPALAWRMWWGGLCPPGRFLVPLVPFLCVALACAVAEDRGWLVRARWALLSSSWLLALFLVWRPEDRLLLNRADRPTRLWEYTLPELGRFLPSLVSTQPRDLVLAAVWLVVLAGVLLLGARGAAQPARRA
jgi:hypothetical protein